MSSSRTEGRRWKQGKINKSCVVCLTGTILSSVEYSIETSLGKVEWVLVPVRECCRSSASRRPGTVSGYWRLG